MMSRLWHVGTSDQQGRCSISDSGCAAGPPALCLRCKLGFPPTHPHLTPMSPSSASGFSRGRRSRASMRSSCGQPAWPCPPRERGGCAGGRGWRGKTARRQCSPEQPTHNQHGFALELFARQFRTAPRCGWARSRLPAFPGACKPGAAQPSARTCWGASPALRPPLAGCAARAASRLRAACETGPPLCQAPPGEPSASGRGAA